MSVNQVVVSDKKFTVYMHITPNGKKYIGITSMPLWKRWGRGKGYVNCTLFYRAILKYGWDNIDHIVLHKNLSKEEACQKERELIKEHRSNEREYGYNIADGGAVNFFERKKDSEETKRRKSEAQKKRYREHPLTEEQKQRMAEICRQNVKKIQYTPELRKKMSEAHKGRPNLACRGQVIPDWQKKLISEANSGANSARARKVICLDTKKKYDTIRFAAKDTNSDERCILNVCNNRKIKTNGLHWAFYDDTKDDAFYHHMLKVKLSIERPPLEKSVRCVETNEIFKSMKEASNELGVHISAICVCCKKPHKTAGGYHWQYA